MPHVSNWLAVGKEWSWKTVYLILLLSPTWWGDGESFLKKKHFRQDGSASFCLKAKNTFDERIKFLRQARKAGAQLLGLPPSLWSLWPSLWGGLWIGPTAQPWDYIWGGLFILSSGGTFKYFIYQSTLIFKAFGWWKPNWASFTLFSSAFCLGTTTVIFSKSIFYRQPCPINHFFSLRLL